MNAGKKLYLCRASPAKVMSIAQRAGKSMKLFQYPKAVSCGQASQKMAFILLLKPMIYIPSSSHKYFIVYHISIKKTTCPVKPGISWWVEIPLWC